MLNFAKKLVVTWYFLYQQYIYEPAPVIRDSAVAAEFTKIQLFLLNSWLSKLNVRGQINNETRNSTRWLLFDWGFVDWPFSLVAEFVYPACMDFSRRSSSMDWDLRSCLESSVKLEKIGSSKQSWQRRERKEPDQSGGLIKLVCSVDKKENHCHCESYALWCFGCMDQKMGKDKMQWSAIDLVYWFSKSPPPLRLPIPYLWYGLT